MAVFACSRCNAPLTPRLSFGFAGDEEDGRPAQRRGRYFVNPRPRWIRYEGRTGDRTDGPTGCIVLNPADVLAVAWHREDGNWSGCCGPSEDVPNLVCASCGHSVGTLNADCYMSWDVTLEPEAVLWAADTAALDALAEDERPAWFATLRGDPLADPDEEEDDWEEEDDDDDDEDEDDDEGQAFHGWSFCVGGGRVWAAAANAPLVVAVDEASGQVGPVVELPNAARAAETQVDEFGYRRTERWSIPGIAFGGGRVWVTDVKDDGLFAIDAGTAEVVTDVRIAGDDDRSPALAPASAVAASDSVVAVTGWGQGDVVLLDPRTTELVARHRAGRSLREVAVVGTTVWVGDDDDGRLVAIGPDGNQSSWELDGRPSTIVAGDDGVWALWMSNTIPIPARLYRVDAATGAETRIHRSGFDDGLAFAAGLLWQWSSDLSRDGDDFTTTSTFQGFDPTSMQVVVENTIEGQLHGLAAGTTRIWGVVWSVEDQETVLVGLDPATGAEVDRIGFSDIDVSQYNPRPDALPTLVPVEFAQRVADEVALALAADPAVASVTARPVESDPRTVHCEVTDTAGNRWSWDVDVTIDEDADVDTADRRAPIAGATALALWHHRDRLGPRVGGVAHPLD